MKECPQCKMITDSHSECQVCKYDVTNVKYSERKSEKYVLNKYLFQFIIKKHLFVVFCILFVFAVFIWSLPDIEWEIFIPCFLLVADSFTGAFYPEWKLNGLSKIYSDSFLDTHFGIHKYITGGLAILIALLYLLI